MKMFINDEIKYVGVNDHQIDLFEGQYVVPLGMAYNSYIVLDEKITIFDTVDKHFFHEWLNNVDKVLKGKNPTYLVIQHMEPDHSANIFNFLKAYPKTIVVSNEKAFKMMEQFFHKEIKNKLVVNDMDTLNIGKHTFTFVFAPMVHWPEVMVTYESKDKILFSADAFGKFGANDVEDPEGWDCEARRYYFGIVGKYGNQVQILLKKASSLDIKIICPLHGPILKENLPYYLNKYNIWSSYQVEDDGVCIFYTSIYGHTKEASLYLKNELIKRGCPKVVCEDLARSDIHENVENAFRYGKVVLATTTYNAGIFPVMETFINYLVERNYQNRDLALIENGSWAPLAGKLMKEKFFYSKNINFLNEIITIRSSLDENNKIQLNHLADTLCKEYIIQHSSPVKSDINALFNIGYGLYVCTCNDGRKDNGLIINTVTQVTNDPTKILVAINKDNYSHNVIKETKKMNINCLSVDAPFSIIEKFGFQSGRNTDKFLDYKVLRSDNKIVYLPRYINAYLSLEVIDYIDMGTHGIFVCLLKEAQVISDKESMTYSYYQKNVKPKPDSKKKGWVCKVCGYVYEGDNLPEDFICPLCKHPASDFEKID